MSMVAFVAQCGDQADSIMKEFAPFVTGTRVLLLLRRHKEGGSNNEYRRRLDRQVSHSPEQFKKALFLMLFAKYLNQDAGDYRIYVTACPRDIRKAELKFKQETLDNDFSGGENKRFFWEHLDDKWVSALMSSNPVKDSALFLADLDYPASLEELGCSVCGLRMTNWDRPEEKYRCIGGQPHEGVTGKPDITAGPLKWCGENGVEVVKQYPTKNGWHLLLKPFNLTKWPKEFGEIKKDPLILLHW